MSYFLYTFYNYFCILTINRYCWIVSRIFKIVEFWNLSIVPAAISINIYGFLKIFFTIRTEFEIKIFISNWEVGNLSNILKIKFNSATIPWGPVLANDCNRVSMFSNSCSLTTKFYWKLTISSLIDIGKLVEDSDKYKPFSFFQSFNKA